MFTKPTDTNTAAIFSVLVLFMALMAAVLIRFCRPHPELGYVDLVIVCSYFGGIDEVVSANQGWQF